MPKTINLSRLFFISLTGLVFLLIRKESFNINFNNLQLIILGGFLCAYLGFELFYNSIKYLKLGVANTIRTLSPLFTLIMARIILNQTLSIAQITGSFLIFSGILILIKNEKIKQIS